jgi:acyl carrier protein
VSDNLELGLLEAEKTLQAHPLIDQAVVMVQRDEMGQQVLGYVAGGFGDMAELAEPLCCYVAKEQADVVPEVFVKVDQIPQTESGEVDRETLRYATRGGQGPGPRITGGLPAVVADIWRDILQVESVALTDDFFDLGGHSLAITRMSIRIRDEMGVYLPLTLFYDSPTVPGIASAIGETMHSRHEGRDGGTDAG